MTLYGDIDPGQHWLWQWLVVWWHQAITWTNVAWSSVKSNDIHIRAISQEMPQPSITKICLKITCPKFHSSFPGTTELMTLNITINRLNCSCIYGTNHSTKEILILLFSRPPEVLFPIAGGHVWMRALRGELCHSLAAWLTHTPRTHGTATACLPPLRGRLQRETPPRSTCAAQTHQAAQLCLCLWAAVPYQG